MNKADEAEADVNSTDVAEADVNKTDEAAVNVNKADETEADVNKTDVTEADVNKTGEDKVLIDHETCVRLLVKAGADASLGKKPEWTALIKSAYFGNSKCVEILLRAGADVNTVAENGPTALIASVSNTKEDCDEMIADAGEIYIETFHRHDICTDLLTKSGADVNAVTKHNETALFYAVSNCYDKCVDILLKSGADVNVITDKGNTILHHCSAGGQVHVLQQLLVAGAHVNITNNNGQNALKHAIVRGNPETYKTMVLLLFAAGDLLDVKEVKSTSTSVPIPKYLLNEGTKLKLKHMCREAIRKHLVELNPHAHLFGRIPKLEGEIPTSMVRYLLYDMSLET